MSALRVHHPGATPLSSLLQRCRRHARETIRQNRGEVARAVLLRPFSKDMRPPARVRPPRTLVAYQDGARCLLRPLCGRRWVEGQFIARAVPGVRASAYVAHFFAQYVSSLETTESTLDLAETTDNTPDAITTRRCCLMVCREEIIVLDGVVTASDVLDSTPTKRLALRMGQRDSASLVGVQCDKDVVSMWELQPGDESWCVALHRFRIPLSRGNSARNLVSIVRQVQRSTQLLEWLVLQSEATTQ